MKTLLSLFTVAVLLVMLAVSPGQPRVEAAVTTDCFSMCFKVLTDTYNQCLNDGQPEKTCNERSYDRYCECRAVMCPSENLCVENELAEAGAEIDVVNAVLGLKGH